MNKPNQIKKPSIIKKKLWASLDASPLGFSYRKLISLVILACVVYIHIRFVTPENATAFLYYDYAAIAIFLGLLNLDRFFELKFGKKDEVKEPIGGEGGDPEVPAEEPVEEPVITDGDPTLNK